jgi:hypothetical protein
LQDRHDAPEASFGAELVAAGSPCFPLADAGIEQKLFVATGTAITTAANGHELDAELVVLRMDVSDKE